MALEIGRICVKTAGREAGKCCVVLKKVDENFVLITGPRSLTKVKRRRCNIQHLEPLEGKIKIPADAPDSDVLQACKKEGIAEQLEKGMLKPSAAGPVLPVEKPAEAKPERHKRPEKKEKPKAAPKKKRPAKPKKPKPELKKKQAARKPAKSGKPRAQGKKPKAPKKHAPKKRAAKPKKKK